MQLAKQITSVTILIMLILFVSTNCTAYFAIKTAAPKKAYYAHSPSRSFAIESFWEIFQSGNYFEISKCLELLKREYLSNPNDPVIPLYIAHLHLWRIAERFRNKHQINASSTDDLTMAVKYFAEAQKLNPEDYRIDGWIAAALMAEASIHKDDKDIRKAYFKGIDSIESYPAFNYFSIGYMFSNHAFNSEHFIDSIDWFYRSMDIAYNEEVDKTHPDITPYLTQKTDGTRLHVKKAVWNSTAAPHNVEGFYLNFGDFLVKRGEIDKARIIYNNAKKLSSYNKWPFRYLLEDRLQNINFNSENFRMETDLRTTDENEIIYKRMIFNSYNCMICHQKR
jgi:tetratricopeptide (TPR) repeat protein